MTQDIDRYPHTHQDSTVADIRVGADVELQAKLHDIIEQLGSTAVERIQNDLSLRTETERLLIEGLNTIRQLPQVDVVSFGGLHLLEDLPNDEATL